MQKNRTTRMLTGYHSENEINQRAQQLTYQFKIDLEKSRKVREIAEERDRIEWAEKKRLQNLPYLLRLAQKLLTKWLTRKS